MPPDPSRRSIPVTTQTPALGQLLDEARGIIDRRNSLDDRLSGEGATNKLKESIGEYGARRHVERTFGSQIKTELVVPRRGVQGPPVLDIVYELVDGRIVVIEAK